MSGKSNHTKLSVKPFRNFSFESKCYLNSESPQQKESFHTSELLPLYNDDDFMSSMPYRLDKSTLHFFPEFYFYFLRHFAGQSPMHYAYCRYTPEKFRSCLIGLEDEIKLCMATIESQHHQAFKKQLSDEIQLWYIILPRFSKRYVEENFAPKLAQYSDKISYAIRLNKLIGQAQKGQFSPLLNFLKAFEYSHNHIWSILAFTYAPLARNEVEQRYVNQEMEKYLAEKEDIHWNVLEFVTSLEIEGIISKPETTEEIKIPEKSNNNKRLSHLRKRTKRKWYTRAQRKTYNMEKGNIRHQNALEKLFKQFGVISQNFFE